jgi:hypothetical protein
VKRLAQLPGGCSVFDPNVTVARASAECSSSGESDPSLASAGRSLAARQASVEQHDPAEGVPLGLTDRVAALDDPLPRAARADAQAEAREIEHDQAFYSDREFAAAAV